MQQLEYNQLMLL